MTSTISVLVAEDSPLFAELLCAILDEDPSFSVAGVATDGKQAVAMASRLQPDIITMDIHMPLMGGLEAVEHIMDACPTPILVVTGDPRVAGPGEEQGDNELNFEALRRGAMDVVAKPRTWQMSEADKEQFRERLRTLAGLTVVRRRRRLTDKNPSLRSLNHSRPQHAQASSAAPQEVRGQREGDEAAPRIKEGVRNVVGIVASTGGPAALAQILEGMPGMLGASIVVVQHIASGFCESLAAWLDSVSPLSVGIARHGEPLQPGRVYLAPDGVHTQVAPGPKIALRREPPQGGHLPSGDRMLCSVAEVALGRGVGVVLTGMGHDGVAGLQALRRAGGATVGQSAETCVVYGMPRAALESGAAQVMVPLSEMASALADLVAGAAPERLAHDSKSR